jgi:1-acyl-sn-glycerol-3-phosphate acyltransferase
MVSGNLPISPTIQFSWVFLMPSDISYEFIRRLVKFSARIGYRLEVQGSENLANHLDGLGDGVIFAANHESVIDAFLMGLTVPPEISRVFFLGKQSALWRNRIWGTMMDYFGVIPVQKRNNDEAIRRGLEVLHKNQALGIFPEGHIRYSRKSLDGKVGVARFAFETESPVVPVGIVGTDGVLPYGGNWPSAGKKVTLIVGEPIYLSYDFDKSDIYSLGALRQATDLVMFNIRQLSSGYGVNPFDASSLKSMKGVDKILIPRRRMQVLRSQQLIQQEKKDVVDHFTEWMTTLSDDWESNPVNEEISRPLPKKAASDEFLEWLNDQL